MLGLLVLCNPPSYCVLLCVLRGLWAARGFFPLFLRTVTVRRERRRKKQMVSQIRSKKANLIPHFLRLMRFNGSSFFCSPRQCLCRQIKVLKYDCCRLTSAKTSVSRGKFTSEDRVRVFRSWRWECILVWGPRVWSLRVAASTIKVKESGKLWGIPTTPTEGGQTAKTDGQTGGKKAGHLSTCVESNIG